MNYQFVCPECGNDINLENQALSDGHVIDCPMCGISLLVESINGANLQVSVTDEGK